MTSLTSAIFGSRVTTSNDVATSADFTLLCDTSGGGFTQSLPATPPVGYICNVIKTAAANTLVVDGNGDTINGYSTLSITQLNQSYQFQYSGTEWKCIGPYTSASANALPWTEVEIDLGSTPIRDKSIVITDPHCTSTSKVVVVPSGNAPTGLTSDEWQMDIIQLAALAGVGSFTLYLSATPGPIAGKRKIFYQINT